MKRTPISRWVEARGHGGKAELARRVEKITKQAIGHMVLANRPVVVVEDGSKIWLEERTPSIRFYGAHAPKAPKHNVTK